MQLQGRNLSLQMKGEDVKLLHQELAQLGYSLPAAETNASLFGDQTYKSVLDFQKQQGLPQTGVVDEATAKRINQVVQARQQSFLVRGRVLFSDARPVAGAVMKAFDKGLCDDKPLGNTAQSNTKGEYEIQFCPPASRASTISASC